jgi:hypothetical protein
MDTTIAQKQRQELLLDLAQREDRPMIVIDGRGYYRFHPGDLGLIARTRIHRLWQTYMTYQQRLMALEEVTLEEDHYSQIVAIEMCSYVVDGISMEILERLDASILDTIINSFIQEVIDEDKEAASGDDADSDEEPDWGEIIPMMQFCYRGADPMSWLHMPMDLLISYQKMMHRLQAHESMRQSMVAAYGHASQKGRSQLDRMWRNTAARPKSGVQYDSQGRIQLFGGAAVRRWFSQYGVRLES